MDTEPAEVLRCQMEILRRGAFGRSRPSLTRSFELARAHGKKVGPSRPPVPRRPGD